MTGGVERVLDDEERVDGWTCDGEHDGPPGVLVSRGLAFVSLIVKC